MKRSIIVLVGLLMGCSGANFEQNVADTEEQYIVVLKDRQVSAHMANAKSMENKAHVVTNMLASISAQYNITASKTFTKVISGGVYTLTPDQVKEMADNPQVAYIEKDHIVTINGIQNAAPWGLDRLDQVSLPLDNNYDYPEEENQVHAYIIDTGVRISHEQFGDRGVHGYDFVDQDNDATDCNGHGTHVAGSVGGNDYGAAKKVKIYGVRVLDCVGSGSFSDVIAGIEWVANNHIKPAVANLSLGGPSSQAVDDAIVAAINAGVTMVVAAGNSSTTACNSSPARVPEAITVGSTTSSDRRSSFSNYGSCVDIFAPGSDITSAWYNSDTATNTISGTSMASPHVAGVAALYLAKNPDATPAMVAEALTTGSVHDKIADTKSGSPNMLLNSNFLENPNPPTPPTPPGPPPSGSELENGVSVVGLAGTQGDEVDFFIDVPAGASDLSFELSGGTGDADLYVKFNEKASTTNFDCRPYKSGNNEVCRFATPQAGTYHVMVRAYRNFADAELKAIFTEGAESCPSCQAINGNLSGTGAVNYHSNAQESAAGQHKLELKGPNNADFDLYLEKEVSSRWIVVAKSIGTSSEETINYSGSAGNYRVRVQSYRGQGDYSLSVTAP